MREKRLTSQSRSLSQLTIFWERSQFIGDGHFSLVPVEHVGPVLFLGSK